jgi:antitoxin ParD1/3/4
VFSAVGVSRFLSPGVAAVNVSIGDRWQGFVHRVVKEGRYGSASEVVRQRLRLVEECEAKLVALRATLNASIAQGGEITDAELDAAISADQSDQPCRPRMGNYFCRSHVRKLFHQLDGWIVRWLWSHHAKRWRNTGWKRYPTKRLRGEEFKLVGLVSLIPSLQTAQAHP